MKIKMEIFNHRQNFEATKNGLPVEREREYTYRPNVLRVLLLKTNLCC